MPQFPAPILAALDVGCQMILCDGDYDITLLAHGDLRRHFHLDLDAYVIAVGQQGGHADGRLGDLRGLGDCVTDRRDVAADFFKLTVDDDLRRVEACKYSRCEKHALDPPSGCSPIPKPSVGFYDFDEYERLIEAARSEPKAYFIILLGGDAGLRCSGMIALEWHDVDLHNRQLCIQRSDWKGHVTIPKGGRLRYVPMTTRLASALKEHRHLRSALVLYQADGSRLSADVVKHHIERAARRAQLQDSGVHRLRHTFCSHLAMRGAPARVIQDLAGHADLSTTQRYMQLSPAAIQDAIRLLDSPGLLPGRGNMVAMGTSETANSPR